MFKKTITSAFLGLIIGISVFVTSSYGGVSFDLPYPQEIPRREAPDFHVLPNGNIVLTDSGFGSPGKGRSELGGNAALGAVFVYNGGTGEMISETIGTTPGDNIGQDIIVIPNGKFLVVSSNWNGGRGAFTTCSQERGCDQSISASNSIIGTTPGDLSQGFVRIIGGNIFVVVLPGWDGAAVDVGAVRHCNSQVGCTGVVSSANSLVGTTAVDRIGNTFIITSNFNYVVGSAAWDNGGLVNAGAAVWCSGASGCTGTVTTANSIHGTVANDNVGLELEPLSNGKYSVISYNWNNGGVTKAGAVTFCNSSFGCNGPVTAANSLHGTRIDDRVGISRVKELPNGAVLVVSPLWTRFSGAPRAGAVTYCGTTQLCTGPVMQNNSLVGTVTNERVGLTGVEILTNGNYVVSTQTWNSSAGAVTFCNGATGCKGMFVNQANSLIGSGPDAVGERILVLPNGNYAVISPGWEAGLVILNRGAATLCNGVTGCQNMVVDEMNSMTGVGHNDALGEFNNKILPNGNFVVIGRNTINGRGSATLCNGVTGCPVGNVSSKDSLIGPNTESNLGSGGIMVLDNGNYVVLSPSHDEVITDTLGDTLITDAGAATFCSGTTGCTGVASSSNSLVGSTSGDRIGDEGVLSGSTYFIGSTTWDDGSSIADAGVVTPCSTSTGCTGPVQRSNSLVGSDSNDFLGSDGIFPTAPGDVAVLSPGYNNDEGAVNPNLGSGGTGAATYFSGDTKGGATISAANSVFGTNQNQFFYAGWDPFNEQMVVARGEDGVISIFRNISPQTAPFDFDGDGRTDIAQWRSANGNWYIDQSTEGLTGARFGLSGDVLTPADYDGDGKTDISVWRQGAPGQAAIYVLNSSDFSVTIKSFGQTGDDPVVVGDWDGDGKADPAVYRDSASGVQSRFYYLGSENNPDNGITNIDWGTAGDKPARGDFDGDGRIDAAIFRPSTKTWWIRSSLDSSITTEQFGNANDLLIPGDYDLDGKTDIAVFRVDIGSWFIRNSTNGSVSYSSLGIGSDIPTPGDYNGDGKIDHAVYRPSNSRWYIENSGSGLITESTFGLLSDTPIPSSGVTN